MGQTLDQQRAEYAWKVVTSVGKRKGADQQDENAKEPIKKLVADYTKTAKSAPALIMGSGLMQTLAFLQAKATKEKQMDQQYHILVLVHIMGWLGPILAVPVADMPNTLDQVKVAYEKTMHKLYTNPDSALYLRATDESLALLRWIRQFADARKAMEG